jgi:hypothetical protein
VVDWLGKIGWQAGIIKKAWNRITPACIFKRFFLLNLKHIFFFCLFVELSFTRMVRLIE